jgi:transketolase
VLGLEPFADKWRAFGWEVVEVDGHDHEALAEALRARGARPRAVIADTTKGKGVDFMEDRVEWHTLVPNDEHLAAAIAQLETNTTED